MPLELEDLSTDIAEHVAKQLNPIDLIELSNCSKQWDHLIKSFKTQIREFYINYEHMKEEDDNSGVASALLGVKPVQRRFVHFFFYKKNEDQLNIISKDPRTSVKVFDDKTLFCQVDQTNLKIFTMTPLETLYSVMDHMLRLFPGPIHHVNFGFSSLDVDEITFRVLERKQIKQCNLLTIPTGVVISPKLFRIIFGLPNLSCLYQHCAAVKRFNHFKEIKIRHLYLSFGEWVTRRSLLCMNCETISLGDPKLTFKDLNVFMKKWLHGDNKRLRRLSITFDQGFKWMENKGRLLDGLKYKKWDEQNSSRERYWHDKGMKGGIDCADGMDVLRSDGALATIKCDSSHFFFFIWRYP